MPKTSAFGTRSPKEPLGPLTIDRRDPGPDGVLGNGDDGGTVKVYDYNAAFRGAAFVANEQLNRPSDRSDDYHSLEFTLNKQRAERLIF